MARFFVEVQTREDLFEALAFAKEAKVSFRVLGEGSNCLFTSDYPGLIIKLGNTGVEVLEEAARNIQIRVAAGENWHKLVLYTLSNGWYGLQNLSLIPGSVGAAPIQNIGAYGEEVARYISRVDFFHLEEKQWRHLDQADCCFGYRDSVFKQELAGKVIIWSVDFQLDKSASINTGYGDIAESLKEQGIHTPGPVEVSQAVIEIRKRKLPDPAEIGNAGSFFKNPTVSKAEYQTLKEQYPDLPGYVQADLKVKIPAAWLIEQAGWKGFTTGTVGVHKRQALVLVHYGKGRGQEILDLAQQIMADVRQKFGVMLQPEVNII